MLWIQLQELPWHVKGDAAGELDTGDGTWTEELRERYADRIQARLARHIPNLESVVLGAHVALARRPAGGEPEPRPRRPVRRLARARPELPLAAVPGQPGPPHAGRPALAHRREHLARARASARARARSSRRSCCGPRRATRAARRLGRARLVAEPRLPRSRALWEDRARRSGGWRARIRRGRITERGLVVPSPAQRSALLDLADLDAAASFADDLDGLRRRRARRDRHLGAEAPAGRRRRRGARGASSRAGSSAASAVPLVPSILPLPLLGGPTDPAERIEALCASIHRLAAFGARAASSA